jgi:chromosome segregation ATPase
LSVFEPQTPKPDNAVGQELPNELGNLKAENESLRQELENVRSQLATVTADRDTQIHQLESKIQNLESQITDRDAEFAAVADDRADLAQFKKEAKEAAAEIHREGRSIEIEKVRWQQQLIDARGELADAKATILKQSDKIRELERGYSFKPNPKESALRLEIGNLQAELSDLKQKSVAASELPGAADLLNQLKAKRKKSSASLADVELILEMIEES